MIVVSDTSPINYLVWIELQDLLPALFSRVLVPEAVRREMQAEGAPESVRQFVAAAPAWLEVRSVAGIPAPLTHLDSGEREAITLALSVGARVGLGSYSSTNGQGARRQRPTDSSRTARSVSSGLPLSGSW